MDPIRLSAFPFDSQIVGYSRDGLPEYDRASNSTEFAGLLKGFFRDGVFSGNALQVLANGGMTATVGTGGVMVQGRVKHLTTNHLVEFDTASNQPRLDRVVIRRDLSNSVRDLVIDVLKGTPATTPAAPVLTRNETVWEICLATVKITANATVVQQSNITDTRLDSNLCGIVAAVLSDFDTTTFYEQIQADLDGFKAEEQAEFVEWFESLKEILDENVAANLQNQINDRVAVVEQDFSAEEKSIARHNIDALAMSDRAADASKLDGKAPACYLHPQNIAYNSDFEHWVAQAGIAGKHGIANYGGDRWILDAGTITGVADENGNGYHTITLNGTIRQKVLGAPVATPFIGMVSGTANISYADGTITITSSGGVIKYVGLYPGEWNVEPPYRAKGYGIELSECQRYYLPLKKDVLGAGYTGTAGGVAYVTVPIPVTMRLNNPSLVINVNDFSAQVRCNGINYVTSNKSDVTCSSGGSNAVNIQIRANGLPENAPCSALIAGSGELALSCDLL